MKEEFKIKEFVLVNSLTKEELHITRDRGELQITKKTNPKFEELKKMFNECDNFCYFCDFSEIVERHHLIYVVDGGKKLKNNKLTLCPNHHYMIHRAGYEIIYCDGFFYLILKIKNRVIPPMKRQWKLKRKCPLMLPKYKLTKDGMVRLDNIKKEVHNERCE